MNFLRKIFGKASKPSGPFEHEVVVRLRGSSLPDEIYEEYDISILQDQLRTFLKQSGLGSFDGNEHGPDETLLFMSGPDAEALFAGVEPILRAYPLCKEGGAIIRQGPAGTPVREVSLA